MEKPVHLKFYLNTTRPNSKGELPVYLRITVDRKKAEVATGAMCKTELWDAETERIRNKPIQNRLITDVQASVDKIIRRLRVEEKDISAANLKILLQNKQTSKETLQAYVKMYHKKYVTLDTEKAEGTKENYDASYAHVEKFLKYKKWENLAIADVGQSLITEYDYWLINIKGKDEASKEAGEKEISRSSTAGHHKKLSSVFKQAVVDKLIPLNPYFGYTIKRVKAKVVALDRDELDRIEKSDLAGNRSLQIIRDIFLFSVYTGLRIGQATKLRTGDIQVKFDKEKNRNREWIKLPELEKTSEPLFVPLLDKAKEIVEKYKQTQEITGLILPPRSHQKINSYLKTIANLCDIDIELHHNHARHTFATLICIENDIPLEVAMKFLGHTDIRSTMIYAEIRNNLLAKFADKMDAANKTEAVLV